MRILRRRRLLAGICRAAKGLRLDPEVKLLDNTLVELSFWKLTADCSKEELRWASQSKSCLSPSLASTACFADVCM